MKKRYLIKNFPVRTALMFMAVLPFLFMNLYAGKIETLVPPVNEYTPKSIRMYRNQSGNLQVAYHYENKIARDLFYYLIHENGKWSYPIEINIPFGGSKVLNDIKQLSSGTPLMVFTGDNTDYMALLNLTGVPELPSDPNGQVFPGFTNEELIDLMAKNKRLFFAFQRNNFWSEPQPIPKSYRALNPVLNTGDNNSACIVFTRDKDNNPNTLNDMELFVSIYNNRYWSNPIQITNNTTYENNVQIQNVNNRYLIVWVSDNDSNVSTRTDKKIRYALVNKDGSVHQGDTLVINSDQFDPVINLGKQGDQAVLLWLSGPESTENPRRKIMESRFHGTWSIPKSTGMYSIDMRNASFYGALDSSHLIYQIGSEIRVAHNDNNQWIQYKQTVDLSQDNWQPIETESFLLENGEVKIVAAGYKNQENQSYLDAQKELRLFSFPLKAKLDFQIDPVETGIVKIGSTAFIRFSVANKGMVSSGRYTVSFLENGQLLKSTEYQSILPGTFNNISYPFLITKAQTNLVVRIESNNSEDIIPDSELIVPVTITPDFSILSLTDKGDGNILVKIKELNGIPSLPITVDYYVVTDTDESRLGSREFNPNTEAFFTFEKPAGIEGYHKFVVDLNPDHSIVESDYSNNQNALLVKSIPDFEITRLRLTSKNVYITIGNLGKSIDKNVVLILTDDPEVASQTVPSAEPLYTTQITLDENNQGNLTVSFQQLGDLSGKIIYAVVNPYNSLPEGNKNNNLSKSYVVNADTSGGIDDEVNSVAELTLEHQNTWCGTVMAYLTNTGAAHALSINLEAIANNQIVKKQFIPVIGANTLEKIYIKNLEPGNYKLFASYQKAVGELDKVELSIDVQDYSEDSCSQNDGRDIALVNATYNESFLDWILRKLFGDSDKVKGWSKRFYKHLVKRLGLSNQVVVEIDISASNFQRSYQYPFIRVPLLLEVKEGIEVKYQSEKTIFISETGEDEFVTRELYFPNSVITENTKLILKTPIRDDETIGSNNQLEVYLN